MSENTPIPIRSDALHVSLLRRGAALHSVRLGERGRNLVLGFKDPADHGRIPAFSGVLAGPVANRIAGGALDLDGNTHQMACNENGVTALHSGPAGIDTYLWDIVAHRRDQVVFQLQLESGAQGLPGARLITATYRVAGPALYLEITARTDAPTPMNIAAHPYWMLDGGPDVSDHQLHMNADHYLPVDKANLPTGDIQPVAGTPFDFTTPRAVPCMPDLDVNYCLADSAHATPQHAATLRGADGTQLDIATTAPGLQVYSGAHLPALAGVLSDGGDLRPYGGIALEPQYWPDAPHHPHFAQITLRPGELWQQTSIYTLTPPAQ